MRCRLAAIGLSVVVIVPLPAACAVSPQQSPAVARPSRPGGVFRGTLLTKPNAADDKDVQPDSVSGTASWRFERDSLDWRRKLTLHIDLAGGRGTYVIRTADTVGRRKVLTAKNGPSSHIDPAYYTASLVV